MRTTVMTLALFTLSPGALGVDDAHRERARLMAERALAYLWSAQDAGTGGWNVPAPGAGPTYPAITGLVLTGVLLDPDFPRDDPRLERGVRFLLARQQPDGGIYDVVLPSYNTSICLSALAHVRTPEAAAALARAQDFVRSLQYGEGALAIGPEPALVVPKEHAFYGGIGYGRHGRPDLSNLSFALQGLHDSGVSPEDAAFQRALVFLSRVQMLDETNDLAYADRSSQGGFIYSTSLNKDEVGTGQSFAGTIDESLDDGSSVSRLRAYGSMTYAGFKSYLYADLERDDPRVVAAYEWISRNYTLAENPGLGTDGMYYYFVTLGRALDAWCDGSSAAAGARDRIRVVAPDQSVAERDWANDLIDRLAELQQPDGSFRSLDDRWLENDPILITAYAVIALRHAAD